MEGSIIIGVMTAVGGLFAGFFALVRYMVNENGKLQSSFIAENGKIQASFLEHLQQKNGHNERIVERFDATVNKMYPVIAELQVQIQRGNDQHMNLVHVLNEASRALAGHNKTQ